MPFCPCDCRRVGLGYLSAAARYTTRRRGLAAGRAGALARLGVGSRWHGEAWAECWEALEGGLA